MVTLYDIDALQKRNAELEAENGKMRKALLEVEYTYSGDRNNPALCPWCWQHKSEGHAHDCQRQLALGLTEVEK